MNQKKNRFLNHTVVFFLITLVVVSVAELILLEIKRGIFAGGFLQHHQLTQFSHQFLFLLVFVATNLSLLWLIYTIWNFGLRALGVHSALISFHFMSLIGLISAITLTIQFQLHVYFGDALDFAVAKNIAGGSLKNALLFLKDEAAILVLFGGASVGAYFLLHFGFKKRLKRLEHQSWTPFNLSFRSAGFGVGGFFGLALFLLYINSVEIVRYNANYLNAYRITRGLFNTISDVDFDGSSIFSFPQDPDGFNASIYPGALDIPGNGVDENGIGGDLRLSAKAETIPLVPRNDFRRPHVVIIVLESARGDLVGKTLQGQLVAPNITKLSQQGTYLEESFSHTGYTASSLGALFTGRITPSNSKHSLFSDMKRFNYNISIFSGQDESWGNLDTLLGTRVFSDNFFDAQVGAEERVFPSKLPSSIKLSGETLWRHFGDLSKRTDWSKPQFLYFNLQAAHFPYFHKSMDTFFVKEGIPRLQINPGNVDWLRDTYWNAIHYADKYVGKIISSLREAGAWENTLLVVVGDHGEELFDEGKIGHGFVLTKIQTHVPLVFSKPNLNLPQPFGHADLKKVILAYAIEGKTDFHALFPKGEKRVFQHTGSLRNPSKIGFVEAGFKRTVLNLRDMQVFSSQKNTWLPYATAMADKVVSTNVLELIHYWESLRWESRQSEE